MTDAPVRLDPAHHRWMTAPETVAVMDALSPGDADRARFVGGCVRNALQGRPVDDIDIASKLTPEHVVEALHAAGLKAVPTGLEHGTITAVADGKPFEITTLRRDVETFGRRAVVAFTTDWAQDAARRDFRLNSIYARRDGSLFDPFNGVADALSGRVVFIGDARQRLAEDVLRILRFYRFNAWYGAGIDPDGQAACAAMADRLDTLAAERVWKEFKKLLSAPDPGEALKAMQEGHVLGRLVSGPLDLKLLLSLIKSDQAHSRSPDPLLRLAALTGRDRGAMRAVLEQMKASNAEKATADALCAPLSALDADGLAPGADSAALARALYGLETDPARGRLRLDEAAGRGDADAALAFVDRFERPVFPLKAKDLIAAGVPRGPTLGDALKRLERDWVRSDFTLDRDALLARISGGAA